VRDGRRSVCKYKEALRYRTRHVTTQIYHIESINKYINVLILEELAYLKGWRGRYWSISSSVSSGKSETLICVTCGNSPTKAECALSKQYTLKGLREASCPASARDRSKNDCWGSLRFVW